MLQGNPADLAVLDELDRQLESEVGDDETLAMLDRPWLDDARAERDPRRVIATWTRYGRGLVTR